MSKEILQQALDIERVALNKWRNTFVNTHGNMPTEADAWKARAELEQPAPVAQAEPLSNKQVYDCIAAKLAEPEPFESAVKDPTWPELIEFVRAIEAVHGINPPIGAQE